MKQVADKINFNSVRMKQRGKKNDSTERIAWKKTKQAAADDALAICNKYSPDLKIKVNKLAERIQRRVNDDTLGNEDVTKYMTELQRAGVSIDDATELFKSIVIMARHDVSENGSQTKINWCGMVNKTNAISTFIKTAVSDKASDTAQAEPKEDILMQNAMASIYIAAGEAYKAKVPTKALDQFNKAITVLNKNNNELNGNETHKLEQIMLQISALKTKINLTNTKWDKLKIMHKKYNSPQKLEVSFNFSSRGKIKAPTPILAPEQLTTIKSISIGDIHGNFKKLLDHFIKYAIVEISDDDYQELMKNPNKMDKFINEGKIIITKEAQSSVKIRLMGDIFADRGSHDNAKLNFLAFLSENNINFGIIYSNHDDLFTNDILNTAASRMRYEHRYNQSEIRSDEVTRFTELFAKHYKLFDFDLDTKAFYSHAPLSNKTFNDIYNLAIEDDNSRPNSEDIKFEEKVVRINKWFAGYAQLPDEKRDIIKTAVWQDITNNRARDLSETLDYDPKKEGMRAGNLEVIKMHYHGHSLNEERGYTTTLDNQCGKDPRLLDGSEDILVEFVNCIGPLKVDQPL